MLHEFQTDLEFSILLSIYICTAVRFGKSRTRRMSGRKEVSNEVMRINKYWFFSSISGWISVLEFYTCIIFLLL